MLIYGTSVLVIFLSRLQQTAFTFGGALAYFEGLSNATYFYLTITTFVIQALGTFIYHRIMKKRNK